MGGRSGDPTFFFHESTWWVVLRLHTKNQCPRCPGSGIKGRTQPQDRTVNLFSTSIKRPISEKTTKMTGNLRANTVCNQVLKVLKESDLNYLVNETPFSAFVTIRKNFVRQREEQEVSEVTPACDDDASLKQKCKGLELKIKDLEKENNTLKGKVCELESEKSRVNIRLEVTKGQLSNQTD